MEKKVLNPEGKLQKIIDLIIENKSDTISVNKLMDIIGNEPTVQKKVSNPFMPGTVYEEYHKNNEYIENYISWEYEIYLLV